MSNLHNHSHEEEYVKRTHTYLVGINVTHSIAPQMHNAVSHALGTTTAPFHFTSQECPTLTDIFNLFRSPTFAGGVITMPYKLAILPHLDSLDEHVQLIGACNNVYLTRDGKLRGSNTDWRGVQGCLESGTPSGTGQEGRGRPAMVVGAGGAARAAVYVLWRVFGCVPIYVVNRDVGEVELLKRDTVGYGGGIRLVHVESVEMAREIMVRDEGVPYFVVGTVPDFEARSPSEMVVRDVLEVVFARGGGLDGQGLDGAQQEQKGEKGVLLDMCFKPRRTRTIELAERYGWRTVEGIDVIGHQIEEQYRLWCGVAEETPITREIQDGAWNALRRAAEESTLIN